ncbi:hypothetical protein BpHYR1_034882 [Brachionus plicatilis]|uniref:Uncharacterized protein n=1 Tax=Brachionus plicatilis TaxID=10195 RepID=A0A3M7Q680_BRAPC|nr:hypothetical protein BpHYR1_034882 [Brachionus plicatilis]
MKNCNLILIAQMLGKYRKSTDETNTKKSNWINFFYLKILIKRKIREIIIIKWLDLFGLYFQSYLIFLFMYLILYLIFFLQGNQNKLPEALVNSILSQVDIMEEIETQEAEIEIQNEVEIAYYLDTIKKESDTMKK